MWKVVCLVALAVISTAVGCTYKGDECPDYTVVETHPDYEVRRYPALTWATTSELTRLRRIGQYTTFMRLFRYISGQNDRAQTMNMTVPVLMQNIESSNGTLYEMSFMVPSQFAADPPVPNDKRIKINKVGATHYAVRTFTGYAWRQETWRQEAQKLAESVSADETVDKENYYMVGYNAPFELFDRRNEIWMVKRVAEEDNEV